MSRLRVDATSLRPTGATVLRLGPASARLDLRAVVVTTWCALLAVLVMCWAVSVGDYPIPLSEVLRTMVGHGVEPERLVIHELRLPRAALAASVGAAFGLSGAVYRIMPAQ